MKQDWTVWKWSIDHWRRCETYHADTHCPWYNPRDAATYRIRQSTIARRFYRVLPAGREPKGTP